MTFGFMFIGVFFGKNLINYYYYNHTTTTTTTHNIHLSFHIVRGFVSYLSSYLIFKYQFYLFTLIFLLYFLSQRFSRFTSGRAGNDVEVEG